jgi:hypothetical protein
MAKKLLIGVVAAGALLAAGAVGLKAYRGPKGQVEAVAVPEFPSLDQARWMNGEPRPMAKSRGHVVLLEGWSPT